MPSQCYAVMRVPGARATALGPCGEILGDYVTTESFVDIAVNPVRLDRQEAQVVNAGGKLCADNPTPPQLRWYDVTITFCKVDPELFNLISAEPLVLNDAAVPEAVGFCSLTDSAASSNFMLEFWVGTDEEGCDGTDVIYGYNIMRLKQGVIGDVTFNNGAITFTVNAITARFGSNWGTGPYNVLVNESGANSGFPGPLLTALNPRAHKCFFWTKLPPPPGVCGVQDVTPTVTVAPLAGPAPLAVTLTFPLDDEGEPMLPAVIDWDDGTALQTVTTGTTANHNYAAAGTYNAVFKPTDHSAPSYISANIVVS